MLITIKKEDCADTMKKLRPILETLQDGATLSFEKGTYHFNRENYFSGWFSKFPCLIGTLNIAFYLKGKKNVVIDGGGSEFIFHGRVTPFLLEGCENIEIRNLTVDYDRPFYSQAEILEVCGGEVRLKFDEGFPYRVEGNNLIFYADDWENRLDKCITRLQEFDPKTRAPAYNSDTILCRIGDGVAVSESAPLAMTLYKAKDGGDGTVVLYGEKPFHFKVGNKLEFCHEDRENNAFLVYGSENVALRDVFIRHCGAFGVMGVTTKDLTLERVHTALDKKSKGLVSTNADSVHIIHCYGKLTIRDCVFENMLDDALNVHGQFMEVVDKPDAHSLLVRCKLWGYNGIEIYRKGKKVNLYSQNTINNIGVYTVKDAQYLPDNDYADVLLTFEEEIEGEVLHGFVENFEMMPELLVQRVKTGRNRPRGFLIQTNKPVLVEECEFYNSNFAINITSDCTYWYESGPVRDVTIRNNKFIDCNYSWGEAPIGITPEYETCEEARYYHKGISVLGNEFYSFTGGMIYAVGVDGLRVRGNKFVVTDTYPRRFDTPKYTLRNCNNCDLE